jgi:hypothetical protein
MPIDPTGVDQAALQRITRQAHQDVKTLLKCCAGLSRNWLRRLTREAVQQGGITPELERARSEQLLTITHFLDIPLFPVIVAGARFDPPPGLWWLLVSQLPWSPQRPSRFYCLVYIPGLLPETGFRLPAG